jgi:two-component system, OmpR family, sensor histidine kinase TctE
LAMARAEDQQQATQKQAVNLSRLAREAVQDFVPRALEKQIDLGLESSERDKPLLIHGNPTLLRELIRNLVDNALLYTPNGGTVTVRVMDDPFGQVVVLQVEDSGPGISVSEREQVFLPFYRVLGTNVDGSGLGLAIVREIAQQHGAEVAIEDSGLKPRSGGADASHAEAGLGQGPGTRFTLRFAVSS